MGVFKFLKKTATRKLPEGSGVYCFADKKDILYIGKAINLRKRVKDHFRKSGFRDHFFMDKVERIGYIQTSSEIEALILEANLIKRYLPKYNVIWRDDKSYFYVAITKEKLPRIFLAHHSKIQNSKGKRQKYKPKVKINFIGPFVDSKALKTALRLLRRIFPYYVSKKHSLKPCQDCLLGLCPGPNPDLKEYRKNLGNLKKVLQGKRRTLAKTLEKEMKRASGSQNFEKAAGIRNQVFALDKIFQHAQIPNPEQNPVITRRSLYYYDNGTMKWKEIAENLRKITRVKGKISRIEAYDISNLQGREAAGSMAVFKNGLPDKSQYRLFKIHGGETPNDTAMIKEVLKRRLGHQEWPYPQLILIDGGIAQLNAALKVKEQNAKGKSKSLLLRRTSRRLEKSKVDDIFFLAIAKRHNELFIEGKKKPLLLKNLPRPVFNLILQLRDEAHRFARNYHLKLRRKRFLGI